ncbi:MAG TPA: trehalase family glycosidase [Feifaniaceae bacterium]|nr:trehalase family glycosidase [Feifaniaceae bacterium]
MSCTVQNDGSWEFRGESAAEWNSDFSNETITARVGALHPEKLSLSGGYDVILPGGAYGSAEALPAEAGTDASSSDPFAPQTVQSGFRARKTLFCRGETEFCAAWWMGDAQPVLYFRLTAKRQSSFTLLYHFGVQPAPGRLHMFTSGELTEREHEGDYTHYSASADSRPENGESYAELLVAFDLGGELTQEALIGCAKAAERESEAYSAMLLRTAAPNQDAAFKAYCLNAAFSSWKRFGSFAGLFAGVAYAAPARTYYRDGYYTALALLPYKPDWVRQEILTLSRGIGADGSCGSAVDANGDPWWNNHYDSPLFFALLTYAYVCQTGDSGILENDGVGEKLTVILDAAADALDENGLLYRPSSRHDWADNVFREGYVTYIECLAYGALHLCGKLLPKREAYKRAAERIKSGINRVLWDDELGWYVNFTCKTETERNLSLDTVFALLFGLAPKDRAIRMLRSMERLLETKNNNRYGEFGVLCVYPFYQNPARFVEKSAYPLRYHNGAEWPYLSALYAFAKKLYGMDYSYPLTRWYNNSLERGFAAPVEYFSPPYPPGGMLQGWSAFGAFVLDHDSADGVFR